MKQNEQSHSRLPRMISYFYAVLILLSLFSVATYTWFSLSRTPEVSDMALYVNSPNGLELSADPLAEEWTLRLDFAQLVEEHSPLRPVTWSENEQRFYAASYGLDGRLAGIWEPLNDSRNANKDNADGYYMMATFYARCDQNVTVSLSPAVEVEQGLQGSGTFVIGKPIWNPEKILHENGGQGAELAIRIGFKIQKTDLAGNESDQSHSFFIYEPNANTHIDGSYGLLQTPSVDLSGSLVPQDRLITQTTSSWTESMPVERDVVVRQLGDFTSNTELFHLKPEELAKITIYVWLEGQDADCINIIGHESQILASIQFAADPDNHGGMVPIA